VAGRRQERPLGLTVDVFRALADPSRRRLLDRLNERSGQTLHELCTGLDMTRQAVSKHLAVLEAANLVTSVRRGREKLHYLNAVPINDIADRWIRRYDRTRVEALADLKRALEDTTMEKPEFVYTTYIHTTPEQLWRGLTDPTFTDRYWGLRFTSDWTAGSTYTLEQKGVTIVDPEQVVVDADPYRRLAYTWHTFTPEWAEKSGVDEDRLAALRAEPRSTVSFDIAEERDGMVRLTVVHGGFEPGSVVLESVSRGWPQVLSALKTLLETDSVLGGRPLA